MGIRSLVLLKLEKAHISKTATQPSNLMIKPSNLIYV